MDASKGKHDLSHDPFLSREPIEGIRFQHNDTVRVIAGHDSGKEGYLVNIWKMEPEPIFIMEEAEKGEDLLVRQADPELISNDSET